MKNVTTFAMDKNISNCGEILFLFIPNHLIQMIHE